jgi:hypothetical protein
MADYAEGEFLVSAGMGQRAEGEFSRCAGIAD